jgi:hypothetical protein
MLVVLEVCGQMAAGNVNGQLEHDVETRCGLIGM